MRLPPLLGALAASALLSASAGAQISVTGPAASFPTSGSGGEGDTWPALGNCATPLFPGTSSVLVALPVTNVDSVTISGFFHSYAGDLQVTLTDPTGAEHNLFVRPAIGVDFSTGGYPGNFTGEYTFVESGAPQDLPDYISFALIPPGTYNQAFDTGGYVWVSGDCGILNTPLCSISAPAGVWTLSVYDWEVNDVGSFSSWTLNANGGCVPTGGPFCFGDGSGTACPCGNTGAAGNGCENSFSTGGANLTVLGTADTGADTFMLEATGLGPTAPALFFAGTAQQNGGAGDVFGDGLRCVGGNVTRLGTVFASVGAASYGPGIAAQTGALAGDVDYFQVWYRNTASFCTPEGFNLTNAWEQTWQ